MISGGKTAGKTIKKTDTVPRILPRGVGQPPRAGLHRSLDKFSRYLSTLTVFVPVSASECNPPIWIHYSPPARSGLLVTNTLAACGSTRISVGSVSDDFVPSANKRSLGCHLETVTRFNTVGHASATRQWLSYNMEETRRWPFIAPADDSARKNSTAVNTRSSRQRATTACFECQAKKIKVSSCGFVARFPPNPFPTIVADIVC